MRPMKQVISTLMAVVLLLACAGAAVAEEAEVCEGLPLAAAAAEGNGAEAEGTPWVDSCVRENLDRIAKRPDSPGDDFYLWTDYDWLKSAEIEPGAFYASGFEEASKRVRELCIDVLNDRTLTGEDARTAQHVYRAFLDWDARDALGVAPLREVTDRIGAVNTLEELAELLGSTDVSVSRLFEYSAVRGLDDPDTWILFIEQPSLLMRDAGEYRVRSGQGDLCEEANASVIPRMLERLGYAPEEAAGAVARAFALEAELAEGMMTEAEKMSPDYYQRANNVLSRAEAEKLCSAFPLVGILDSRGFGGAQRCLVAEPAYLRGLDGLWREERLEDLKNYLTVRTVSKEMEYLDRESYALYVELNNRMRGSEGTIPDEELACKAVRLLVPAQMNNAFFEKHDPSKMKADITRICEEAIDCYRGMIREEDWLTEETREKALEKLDRMTIVAVSPDRRPDYSGLSVEGLGYFDCVHAAMGYEDVIQAGLVDQPVDRGLWYWTGENAWANDILVTNAAYDPSANTIVILRGILEEPIYREDMSEEELCGAIGMIIAHEISHAFDPSGSQFDAAGRIADWWTEADREAFSARAARVIGYYDGMTVFGGYAVSGANVQGEAVADMAGVKCMLRLLEQKKDTVDYRTFFESFAYNFREIVSPEAEAFQTLTNPHPPNFIRVNSVVQQFPQFHEAYGVMEGDGMFLAPEDRVQVW